MDNDVLQAAFEDILRRSRETEVALIEADPNKYKLTRIMGPKGSSYRYFDAGRDGRGWQVRFCYSCWRNAAGYFLSWREIIPPKGSKAKFGGKRDKFAARKVRKRARTLAERRCEAFKAKYA